MKPTLNAPLISALDRRLRWFAKELLAAAMRERGVDIGRAPPPYTNWARITIGLPSENLRAQNALRTVLKET
jgi:histidinol-phosphate/aromatic aminotransferase/cobyric acid decarboxylase-like protein